MQTEIIEKIAKLFSGEATQNEISEINAWRNESAAHERYFNECRECWMLTEETPGPNIMGKNKTWEQIILRINPSSQTNAYSQKALLKIVTIAAVIAVFLTSSVFLILEGRSQSEMFQVTEVVIAAPAGQKAKVMLPDSSKVWLNSESILSYRTDFGISKRSVKITGEAFFDVSHDKSKPFCVHTDQITVRVLGTQFNINSPADDLNTTISLVSGKVDVLSAESNDLITSLEPGQKAIVDNQSLNNQTIECDTALESIWRLEQLKIRMEPIAEVVRKMEYWYGVDIDLQPSNNEELYWLTIKEQSIAEMLNLIDKITPIDYTINGRHITICCKN